MIEILKAIIDCEIFKNQETGVEKYTKELIRHLDGKIDLKLLHNRKVVMTPAYSGGILDAIRKRNEDLAIVWDGQIRDMVVWVIPKGNVNLKEALDFIVFASDPKRMAAHANYIAYAPVRKSAMAFIDDSVRRYLPTATENAGNVLRIDYKWWNTDKQAIEIESRFAKWRIEKPWRPNFEPQS